MSVPGPVGLRFSDDYVENDRIVNSVGKMIFFYPEREDDLTRWLFISIPSLRNAEKDITNELRDKMKKKTIVKKNFPMGDKKIHIAATVSKIDFDNVLIESGGKQINLYYSKGIRKLNYVVIANDFLGFKMTYDLVKSRVIIDNPINSGRKINKFIKKHYKGFLKEFVYPTIGRK